jgi:hypothetical protein
MSRERRHAIAVAPVPMAVKRYYFAVRIAPGRDVTVAVNVTGWPTKDGEPDVVT